LPRPKKKFQIRRFTYKRSDIDEEGREVKCSSLLYRNPMRRPPMTEERKHAILFAATLLSARRMLETIDSDKPNMAEEFFIERTVIHAARILEVIDKWCNKVIDFKDTKALVTPIVMLKSAAFARRRMSIDPLHRLYL
jgi:hypothetical protein